MDGVVHCFERASDALERAGTFLASRPVEHNLILTLLDDRRATGEPGRYWVVEAGEQVVGVVFQSPLHYGATLTPMPVAAVSAAVHAIVEQGIALPGVGGEAAAAASFAGCWTERTKLGAVPSDGQRLYLLGPLRRGEHPPGSLRRARPDERAQLVEWFTAFQLETGESAADAASFVDAELAGARAWVWVWEADAPVSMATHTQPIENTVRIRAVYTPPALRGLGYASACVDSLSDELVARGHRCILYADLANPTSNAIYRRLGYAAVAELVRYRFITSAPPTR